MPLLILGASARSAAQSAWRAGLPTFACDLFADRDLAAGGLTLRIEPTSYPERFEGVAAAAEPGPWIYTGALENHPDLIDRIAETRPLWGIHGSALRNVRDASTVSASLGRRGLLAPGVREVAGDLPRDGSWLIKPRFSAGGRSIRPLVEASTPPGRPSIYQERIEGTSLAAVFVGKLCGATLLGVTRQLLGRDGEPFAYIGSIGPWPISERTRAEVRAVGSALTEAFGLRGLFGVDLILKADGRPVPVEVNPRYTASVEVLELTAGRSFLAEHRGAFEGGPPEVPRSRARSPACVGKAILFADRRCTLPALEAWRPRTQALRTFAVPVVADVPAAGEVFEAGAPILTVMARGTSVGACEVALHARLDRWRGRLRTPE